MVLLLLLLLLKNDLLDELAMVQLLLVWEGGGTASDRVSGEDVLILPSSTCCSGAVVETEDLF